MDHQAEVWNQYHNLREEIRGADSLNYQIMGIIVGAVAALLTTAIKEDDPLTRALVFLCVYVVTIPGYGLLRGNRRRIWRVSTYLREFVEPELQFVKWETRLQQQGELKGSSFERGRSSFACTSEWLIVMLVNTLAALGAIFSLLTAVNAINLSAAAVIGLLCVWLFARTSRQERELRRGGSVERALQESWKRVREDEGHPTQALKRAPGGAA